ncbi:GatB/YqeY domain-containing protein [Patescibacteria group bacterium]|nr:GatB/YqeY domain-containing protein [Patescibacteria group bacterium]
MMLDNLQTDMTQSLKKGNRLRVETLRFLISAVRNAAIAKYANAWESSLTDADVIDVIKKQVKSHRESVEAFEKAGRTELVDKEKKELDILSAFLPKGLSDDELKALLVSVVAEGDTSNFGLLMKAAMAKVKGQVDGARVSAMLKQLLQNVERK